MAQTMDDLEKQVVAQYGWLPFYYYPLAAFSPLARKSIKSDDGSIECKFTTVTFRTLEYLWKFGY